MTFRIAALWLLAAAAPLAAQDTDKGTVVEVTGTGATRWEARQDAVRRALSTALPQLVVADRAVKNDDLAKDEVITTMNGVVDRFEVLGEKTEKDEVTLQARVTVMPSRMQRFIASSKKGQKDVQVDGSSMLAAAQAVAMRAKATGSMIERLFDGHPGYAFDAKVREIKAFPERDAVQVTMEVWHDTTWVRALRTGLEAMYASGTKVSCKVWDADFEQGCPSKRGARVMIDGKQWMFPPPVTFTKPPMSEAEPIRLAIRAKKYLVVLFLPQPTLAGDDPFWGAYRDQTFWVGTGKLRLIFEINTSFFEDTESLAVSAGWDNPLQAGEVAYGGTVWHRQIRDPRAAFGSSDFYVQWYRKAGTFSGQTDAAVNATVPAFWFMPSTGGPPPTVPDGNGRLAAASGR